MQEGKTIKSSSGFSGKGFKFDETEHALANERKKLQKAALGLQDSDDEDGALDVSKPSRRILLKSIPASFTKPLFRSRSKSRACSTPRRE